MLPPYSSQESKRAFFYSIVTEGGDKEKLEAFVNFCEDAVFEMTHASGLMAQDDSGGGPKNREAAYTTYISEEDEERYLNFQYYSFYLLPLDQNQERVYRMA